MTEHHPSLRPGVRLLATLASPAVIVEPQLMRALRLAVAPSLDVGTEADVWFSPMVQDRSSRGLILFDDARLLLVERLAEQVRSSAPDDPVRGVGAIIERCHAGGPPLRLVQERATWAAIVGDEPALVEIRRELGSVISAAREPHRSSGVLRWAARVMEQLPDPARRTGEAWSLHLSASAMYGGTRRLTDDVPPDLVDIGYAVPPDPDDREELAVSRDGGTIRLGTFAADHAQSIAVPSSRPVVLELSWPDRAAASMIDAFDPATERRIADHGGRLRIKNLVGETYVLEAELGPRVAVRSRTITPDEPPDGPRLEIQGRIVPLARDDPTAEFVGRVNFSSGTVAVRGTEHPATLVDAVRRDRADPEHGTVQVDVGDSFVYPALSNLRRLLSYDPIPLWDEPTRTNGPWLHRDLWPSAPSYREKVSWPAQAYRSHLDALLAYSQVAALAGGQSTVSGWPPMRWPDDRTTLSEHILVRPAERIFPEQAVVQRMIGVQGPDAERLRDDLDEGLLLIQALSEGQQGSKAVREFEKAAEFGLLRQGLVAAGCSAVDAGAFRQWRLHAQLAGESGPGGVVWSPFSDLWLYGETLDVQPAIEEELTVCLSTNWSPTGTRNLLGELKAALLWVRRQRLNITDFDLCRMVTSSPGDLLDRAWGAGPGRLEPGRLGDAVVVARRHADPWKNLVMARERDIELVVVDGRAVYGDRSLLRESGQGLTSAVPVGGGRTKHVVLRKPDAATQRWTWQQVIDQLEAARNQPLDTPLDGPDRTDAAEGAVTFDMPPIAPLTHTPAWLRSVRGRGWHDRLWDELTDLF